MKPEHLNKLREICEQFQQGTANHENIRQLNEILTIVNRDEATLELSPKGEKATEREYG